MLMLIPLSIIMGITITLFMLAQSEAIEAQASMVESSARAIAFHHDAAVRQPVAATGYVDVPASGIFSAFEGLQTYAHIEGGTTFLVTWPARFSADATLAAPSHHSDEVLRNSFRQGARDLANAPASPGMIVHGSLEFATGAFSHQVGNVMLPFGPPALEGAPVILTILSGT